MNTRHPHHLAWDGATGPGRTAIARRGGTPDTGMDFDLARLAPGETVDETVALETAWLLLDGAADLGLGDGPLAPAARASMADDAPVCLHLPAGGRVRIVARTACEFAVFATDNDRTFAPMRLDGDRLACDEDRDRGRWHDAAWRIVRTIFDARNRPDANLVLGEVVTLPGRWSSYPPHHHPQPEIYHYRFPDRRGYGHAELGDAVVKVRHGDTTLIVDANDHSQVAAPGYAMCYVWAIRHLPGAPYTVPEFTLEHRWLLDPDACVWAPAGRDAAPGGK